MQKSENLGSPLLARYKKNCYDQTNSLFIFLGPGS